MRERERERERKMMRRDVYGEGGEKGWEAMERDSMWQKGGEEDIGGERDIRWRGGKRVEGERVE